MAGLQNGDTPLHLAAAKGRSRIVRNLVAAGANVNAQAKNYCTPMHLAAASRHREVVGLLLDAGGDPTIQSFVRAPCAVVDTQTRLSVPRRLTGAAALVGVRIVFHRGWS